MTQIRSLVWRRLSSGTLPLVAILAIAAAIRFNALDTDSLWYDTASSIATASNDSWSAVLRAVKAEMQFPLYFLILHLWLKLGVSDAWVSALSAFFGVATVGMTYVVGASFFSRRVGLLAATISAISSYQVFYSRYPRSYLLLSFFALASVYFLRQAVTERRPRWWVAYVITTLLALYTHPYTFPLVLGQWLFVVVYAIVTRDRRLASAWLISQLVLLVGLIPWMPAMYDFYLTRNVDAWIPPTRLQHVVRLYDSLWFRTIGDYPNWLDRLFYWGRFFLAPVVLWGLVGRGQWREKGLLWLVFSTPIISIFLVSEFVQPIWVKRYFVFLAPPFAVIAAFSFWRVWERGRIGKVTFVSSILIMLLILAMPLVSLFKDNAYRNQDVKGAAAWVRERYQPNDAIVHTNYQSYLPSLWYNRRAALEKGLPLNERALCAWKSTPRKWCAAAPYHETTVPFNKLNSPDLDRAKRLWLVIMYDHRNERRAPREMAGLLAQVDRYLPQGCQWSQDFRGVTILLCDKGQSTKVATP